jgi:tetratricopeptide (TPR) repeat protein
MLQDTTSSGQPVRNKGLIIGIVVAVILVTIGILKAALQPSAPKDAAAVGQVTVGQTPPENFSAITAAREKVEAQAKEKARAAIAEHEAIIESNPRADDTPDRIMAVGNLYSYQIGDYASAIQRYRDVVDRYPAHSQMPQAYIELASCYERLGDADQARYIYREMVEKLDSSLQHTKYAKQKLEGK